MIRSLFMKLVLYYKGNLFLVAYMFLMVRLGASYSYGQFIMEDTEDTFSLLLSTNILSLAVL